MQFHETVTQFQTASRYTHGMSDTPHQDRLAKKEPLRIASWNLQMLGQTQDPRAYHNAASVIMYKLDAPHILAVQELCGHDLREDGKVHATDEAAALIAEIQNRGGPTYAYCEAPPLPDADGGAPGENIRCGYFYRPDRVCLTSTVSDPQSPYLASQEVDLTTDDGKTRLQNHNPARIRPKDRDMRGTRKPLVAQFTDLATQEQYFITNVHLSADWGLYDEKNPHTPEGAQPRTEEESKKVAQRRSEQARMVGGFVRQLGESTFNNREDRTTHVMVLGDFNTHWVPKGPDSGEEMLPRALEPIAETGLWQASGVAGAHNSHREGERTSCIDHAFISRGLRTRLTQIDRPDINGARHRASDHNPLRFTLAQEALPPEQWIFNLSQSGRVR